MQSSSSGFQEVSPDLKEDGMLSQSQGLSSSAESPYQLPRGSPLVESAVKASSLPEPLTVINAERAVLGFPPPEPINTVPAKPASHI